MNEWINDTERLETEEADEEPGRAFFEKPAVADAAVRDALHRRDPGDELDAERGTTVAALFTNPADAQRAIRELQDEGFSESDIGVLMRDHKVSADLVMNPAAYIAEGAAMGAVEGGLLGGVLGLIVGALVVPGVGPIVAGGALASALATAGPTALAGLGLGAATGGIVGALSGSPLPEEHEERLREGIRAGGVAVTVHAGDRAADAVAIMVRNNGDTGGDTGNLNPLYHDQPAFVKPERAVEASLQRERADNLDLDVDEAAEDPRDAPHTTR